MKPHYKVVAAVIRVKEKFLICRRLPHDRFGLKWEFPGGKVESGESLTRALTREIKEELGVDIVPARKPLGVFTDETPDLGITVYVFSAEIKRGEIKPLECADYSFVNAGQLKEYDLAPVDVKIADYLLSVRGKK